MRYFVFPLEFITPVHFGNAFSGGNLENVTFTCSADTFFSALCNEAASVSDESVEKLINLLKKDELRISSLFPYYKQNDELCLYLPKPLLQSERAKQNAQSFAELKKLTTEVKRAKKMAYVRASRLGEFVEGMLSGRSFTDEEPVFAVPMTACKVNTRNEAPLPYYVGSYVFTKQSGLYFICGAEDDAAIDLLSELVESLGYSGIGGKRSSGYGKYQLADDPWELFTGECFYEDDKVLLSLLTNKEANIQMCIAPVLPQKQFISVVKQGSYKLLKRGGFIHSAEVQQNMKRSSIYMLAEGSCFKEKILGLCLRQNIDGVGHPVYRNGVGMFLGVGQHNEK